MTMLTVTNHQPGVLRLKRAGLELLPGDNDVTVDDWNKVKRLPHVVDLLGRKFLSVGAGGETAKPLPTATSTTDMNAKEAIATVEVSTDLDWLRKSYAEDSRSTVEEALFARIGRLEEADGGDSDADGDSDGDTDQ